MTADTVSTYRLHGRALALARAGWIAVALLLLVPMVVSWPLYLMCSAPSVRHA